MPKHMLILENRSNYLLCNFNSKLYDSEETFIFLDIFPKSVAET